MLESLQKFNNLPVNIKRKVSTEEVFSAVEDLENRYNLSLANLIIRVMIKEFDFAQLPEILEKEFKLDNIRAATLEAELRSMVFKDALDYLTGEENISPAPIKIETVLVKQKPTAADAEKVSEVVEKAEKSEENIHRLLPAKIDLSHLLLKNQEEKEIKKVVDAPISEKEIAPFAEQAASMPPKVFDLEKETEEVLKLSGLVFASSELSSRLKKVILTYLKGIRTKAEAREGLLKSVLSGGLSLEEAEADKVLSAADSRKNLGNSLPPAPPKKDFALGSESNKTGRDGGKTAIPAMVEYDLAAELKKKAASAEENNPLPVKEEVVLPVPKKEENIAIPAAVEPEKIEESVPEKFSENKEAVRAPVSFGSKKKMDDISAPQVMSPIDELEYMDLITFRRLGNTPQKIGEKIKSIVDLLANEGLDKQLQAVQAWRRSPINRTYLSMGQESITEGKSIDDIIIDRKEKNLNYLTREEFEAIMDLNNRLRF